MKLLFVCMFITSALGPCPYVLVWKENVVLLFSVLTIKNNTRLFPCVYTVIVQEV